MNMYYQVSFCAFVTWTFKNPSHIYSLECKLKESILQNQWNKKLQVITSTVDSLKEENFPLSVHTSNLTQKPWAAHVEKRKGNMISKVCVMNLIATRISIPLNKGGWDNWTSTGKLCSLCISFVEFLSWIEFCWKFLQHLLRWSCDFLSFILLLCCSMLINLQTKSSLHPWKKSPLIMMYDPFDVLLGLAG